MPTEEGLIPIQTGELVLDAACTPTDIAYPFDIQMLYRARLKTEVLIDKLPAQSHTGSLKPRTCREKLQHKMESIHQNPQTSSGKNQDDLFFSLLVSFNEASVPASGVF